MAASKLNTAKLGVFVMAGLSFLILLLYIIGKNQNLFGSTFELKARFENVNGLIAGANVRFAGIDAGSVKSIDVLNDTTIEATLMVKNKMKPFIHRNASISIGTDGLIGNRVVNIEPSKTPAPVVQEGEVLWGVHRADADQMLQVLSTTNNDIASIAAEIKRTIRRINDSRGIWGILEDESLPGNIRSSVARINKASVYMSQSMQDLSVVMDDVKNGKGSLGRLLRDTALSSAAVDAIRKVKDIGTVADSLIRNIGVAADSLSAQIGSFVSVLNQDVSGGKGTVHALLKDEKMAQRLDNTLRNLEQDTQSFNEVMDALKNSFLFRGYFRKLERQKQLQQNTTGKY